MLRFPAVFFDSADVPARTDISRPPLVLWDSRNDDVVADVRIAPNFKRSFCQLSPFPYFPRNNKL